VSTVHPTIPLPAALYLVFSYYNSYYYYYYYYYYLAPCHSLLGSQVIKDAKDDRDKSTSTTVTPPAMKVDPCAIFEAGDEF